MGRAAILKTDTEAHLSLGPFLHDPRSAYKRAVPQADEMYRKFRWQFAPGGPKEDAMLYEMATEAQTLIRNARKAHGVWCEYVEAFHNHVASKYGMAAKKFEDLQEGDLRILFNEATNQKSIDTMIDNANIVSSCSRKLDAYHQRIMLKVDTELRKEDNQPEG